MSKTPIRSRINIFIRNAKSAWYSPQGKEIFTFFCFVVLAAGIWLILSISDNRERTIQIPIELTDIPEETVLLQDMPSHIEARIRDKGPVILGYNLKNTPPIKIDFDRHDNNKDAIIISNNSLVEYARKQLKATTSILAFTPDSIRINYTNDHGKRVPVIPHGHITTSPHSTISDSTYTIPDSVVIYGRTTTLKDIDCIYTEEFVFNDITETVRTTVAVKPVAGTRIIPDSVTITIPVEEYTTKTLSIPIAIGEIPDGYSVMTFPSHVTVTCLVPVSKYANTVSEDFLIGNTFDGLQNTLGSYGAIEVTHAPDYARNIMLSQDSIEYIINENTTPIAVQQ